MAVDDCPHGGKKPNGNCGNPGDDGLAVQCVGEWVEEKHEYLRRFLDASSGARRKFLGPRKGGAAFIDLFAGPGRARVRTSGKILDGSPLVVLGHDRAPFSKVILCELDPENAEALRKRTAADSRVVILEGNCHESVDELLRIIPADGLNLALIDPFSLDELKFATIRRLASLKRLDLLIHFPTMDARRNFGRGAMASKLTRAVGTETWTSGVHGPPDVPAAIRRLQDELSTCGYTGEHVRSLPVRNSRNALLYHLVFASKDRLGDELWTSITSTSAQGQRSFTFK